MLTEYLMKLLADSKCRFKDGCQKTWIPDYETVNQIKESLCRVNDNTQAAVEGMAEFTLPDSSVLHFPTNVLTQCTELLFKECLSIIKLVQNSN
jgi:hypothetical protein